MDFDQHKFKENQSEAQYKTVKYLIEKNFKNFKRKKLNTYNSVPLILSTDVFKDILQFRVWDDNIQVQKKKRKLPTKNFVYGKTLIKHEGEITIVFR